MPDSARGRYWPADVINRRETLFLISVVSLVGLTLAYFIWAFSTSSRAEGFLLKANAGKASARAQVEEPVDSINSDHG